MSSLPQSAAIASAYGFGSSTSIPGGTFPVNQPTAPAGTTIGYDDVLSSQFKEASHLMSLQQQVIKAKHGLVFFSIFQHKGIKLSEGILFSDIMPIN